MLLFGKSEYGFGGADNINHYQIARYAFSNPELFFDLWGETGLYDPDGTFFIVGI